MPRTKPQQIKPESSVLDRLGRTSPAPTRPRPSSPRSSSSCATPSASARSARRCRRASCCTARPARARRCSPRPSRGESGAQFFSQSAAVVRRDVRRPRRGAHPAAVRRGAQARARRSSSSTSSTPSAAQRGSDNNSEREQTLNQLLVEMDGFNSTGDLVVIAASNLLEKLDPGAAAPRPLRPPDLRLAARRRAAARRSSGPHAHQAARRRRRPRDARAPDRRADRRRPGQHLQRGGDLRRPRRAAREITQADFDAALERVVAGMQSRRTLNEHERRVVAWHEAGPRAVRRAAAGRRPRAQDLDRPARAARWATRSTCPRRTATSRRARSCIDYMTVLLGGRVAEEIVFGAITTGASDDLHRVAEISRAMVHEYAMGTSITSRKISAHGGEVSDRTRELRDEEQQHLADEAKRAAARLHRRAPRQARRARGRAAAQRGARARRHRAHHGRHAAVQARRRRPARGRRRASPAA